MRCRLPGWCCAVLLLLQAPALAGQTGFSKPPERPRLPAERDPNSAQDYYGYGVSILERDPVLAAAAFYWASRLDPNWASPLYGEYTALMLARPSNELETYLTRPSRALEIPAIRRIDSLVYFARLRNPYVDRRLGGLLISTWIHRVTGGEFDLRDLGRYDRWFTAWSAYCRSDFRMAASVYAEILRRDKDPGLYMDRSLVFVAMGQLDSARAMARASLDATLEEEDQVLGLGWYSHALASYSIGYLHELAGQHDSARAAYEQSLLDDVTFHPAHRGLAAVRLAAGDSAGALEELGAAVQLAPHDAGYLYDLGILLLARGRADSGATLLRRSTEAEPYYALPHYPLAVVYERGGFAAEAVQEYETFLALAPRSMGAAITTVQSRVAALKARAPAN